MNDLFDNLTAANLIVYSLSVCLLLAGWLRAHVWSRQLVRPWTWVAFAGRSIAGFLTLFLAAGIARQVVTFSTTWQLWPILLLGAILIEGVIALARLERNIVSPRAGRALTLLRVAIILAVVLMLCQPVFVLTLTRQIQRHVVLLLDVSASMQVPDNNLTAAEKLRLAEVLKIPAARRSVQVDKIVEKLGEATRSLRAQTDWLTALSEVAPELRAKQLKQHAKAQRKALREVRDIIDAAVKSLQSAAAAPFLQKEGASCVASLKGFADRLNTELVPPLERTDKSVDDWQNLTNSSAAYDSIRTTVQQASTFLTEAESRLSPLGNVVDAAFYQSLPEPDRKTIDQLSTIPRSQVAARLLTTRDIPLLGAAISPVASSVLERLDRDYGVKLFTVGAFPVEVKPGDLLATTGGVAKLPVTPLQLPATDLAGALEKVAAAMQPEQTAGVILLSDGRHNAPGSVEAISRKFGTQHVPVYALVLGGNSNPPTDAAIVSVVAPESVSTNDRVSFVVDVKLDGLAGSNVTVTLFDGVQPVVSNTVTPTAAAFRKQLLLSDAPKTNGLHAYRVETQVLAAEVDSSNNVFHVPVRVASDRVNVLLIDGQPRWEFRYLKNLFMQRDKNVKLQYLLFRPDQIDGITNRPVAAASVSTDRTEAEATLLPATEAEWMKFDVIILGDVAPAELGRANMEILRNYVRTRGGSLLVIAGSRHMPHAYTGTPLAEILPVTFKPSIRPLLSAPEGEFRFSLTAEGRNTVFLRLDDEPAANLKAWSEVPDLRWRNGSLTAKNGATVLAYATPPVTELDGRPVLMPDAETLLKQQQYERENALLVKHQAGLGSVLMFGFDQTWRLRYKRGDQYYHKFWGQILSWSTADRIATGSSPLRIGTPHARNPAGSPVQITARLAGPDFMPVINAAPHGVLWAGARKVSRFRLSYKDGSPGIYAGEIGALPEGHYRVELDLTGIAPLSAAAAAAGVVATEFSVVPGSDSEKVELAADRGVLTSLAGLSAGALVEPAALDSIAERLGPAKITKVDRRQIELWNSWPWFVFILVLLSAEWLLRKKVRLP